MNMGFDVEMALTRDGVAHPASLVLPIQDGPSVYGGWKVYPDGFNLEVGSSGVGMCMAYTLDTVAKGIARSLEWGKENGWGVEARDCVPICTEALPYWPPEAVISGCNPTMDAFDGGRQVPVFASPWEYRESLVKYGTCCGAHLHFQVGRLKKEEVVALVKAVVKSALATSTLMAWDSSSAKRFKVLGVGKFRYKEDRGILEFKDFGSNILRSHWNMATAMWLTRNIINGYRCRALDLRLFDEIPDKDAMEAYTSVRKIRAIHDFAAEALKGRSLGRANFYSDRTLFETAASTPDFRETNTKKMKHLASFYGEKWEAWFNIKDLIEFAIKRKEKRNMHNAWMLWLKQMHCRGAESGLAKHYLRYAQ